VQSGAPDANRARAFSRFETHNQMAWVSGGLIPVVLNPSGRIGFLVVGVVGIAGAVMFIRSGGASIALRGGRATGPERRSR
jgi:hypothetical protein